MSNPGRRSQIIPEVQLNQKQNGGASTNSDFPLQRSVLDNTTSLLLAQSKVLHSDWSNPQSGVVESSHVTQSRVCDIQSVTRGGDYTLVTDKPVSSPRPPQRSSSRQGTASPSSTSRREDRRTGYSAQLPGEVEHVNPVAGQPIYVNTEQRVPCPDGGIPGQVIHHRGHALPLITGGDAPPGRGAGATGARDTLRIGNLMSH